MSAVPLSILLVTQVFPPRTGGSGRWFWELYRRLTGVDIHVAAGRTDGDVAFDRDAGIPIERMALDFPNWGLLHPGGGPHYVRGLLELRRRAARVEADVLHCGKCLPEGLLAAGVKALRGTPFVVYAHGEELTLARTSRELSALTHYVLKSASQVISNSRHTKGLLTSGWGVPEKKIVVMHPGVDTERFAPAAQSPGVRHRLGWTARRVVLTAGALQKRKGQDMMLRALPAIRAACPDVLYCMIGQPVERPYLERLVDELGVADLVQFRGTPADQELIDCYQQCDLFSLPSRQVGWDFEGFGIVALEAQACGKPVVVGRTGGAPETVQAGLTGEVVDCERPEPLAAAIIGLLEDRQRMAAMGTSGRQWVVNHFDWQALGREASAMFKNDRDNVSRVCS